MSDSVVEADAVEQHVGGLAPQPTGEDLAVVGQDLLRDAVGVKRLNKRVADWPRSRSSHHVRDHAEAGMVIDARYDR
jgi:hypothetical protein